MGQLALDVALGTAREQAHQPSATQGWVQRRTTNLSDPVVILLTASGSEVRDRDIKARYECGW
jgi:hypothetical protein